MGAVPKLGHLVLFPRTEYRDEQKLPALFIGFPPLRRFFDNRIKTVQLTNPPTDCTAWRIKIESIIIKSLSFLRRIIFSTYKINSTTLKAWNKDELTTARFLVTDIVKGNNFYEEFTDWLKMILAWHEIFVKVNLNMLTLWTYHTHWVLLSVAWHFLDLIQSFIWITRRGILDTEIRKIVPCVSFPLKMIQLQ